MSGPASAGCSHTSPEEQPAGPGGCVSSGSLPQQEVPALEGVHMGLLGDGLRPGILPPGARSEGMRFSALLAS